MQNADEIHCPNTTPHTLRPIRGPTRKQQLLGKVPCGQLFIVAVELQTIPQGTIHNRGLHQSPVSQLHWLKHENQSGEGKT